MNWKQLLSSKRFGLEDYHDPNKHDRTEFQRDYDRLIFSPTFRRLQNKTQVFPLPGKIFVHNRLTHSLEVSCVGRSLGEIVSRHLTEKYGEEGGPYIGDLGSIVPVGCLAHDLGNPPFGHSGEKAISSYFSEGPGLPLKEKYGLTDAEWQDIVNFEGNANALRLLTHQFGGHRPGGFVLTYTSLASIVKYPYESTYITKLKKAKFGFFQSEKASYERIARELGIVELEPGRFARHPLVYLVEAADDICYEIMDIEDAHKLKLLSTEQTVDLMLDFFDEDRQKRRREHMNNINDVNEQIAYLRSSVVGVLVSECSRVFNENEEDILNGSFTGSLLSHVDERVFKAYRRCEDVSLEKIYKSQAVADVEISGYNIIYKLVDHLVNAALEPDKAYSRQLLTRVPRQYEVTVGTYYQRIIAVLDYVSSMTDIYALELYQQITGISLPHL
ncbi:MAG: deoxyguanosinetriphosphate triphosphohydrolase [Paludibacteraceae bacterium]|nr:deoxyguanosinetriphosphate triphosphohydrolase [Paludibacteraceae bacterium]